MSESMADKPEHVSEEERVDRWVYLTVWPSNPGPYYVKELAEDWAAMTEEQRQEWLYEVSVEFGWGGAYTYEESAREK